MSDLVIKYTDRAGSIFLSAPKIPVTTSLSPAPMSVIAAATAALSTGFSGGTRLNSVLSEIEAVTSPSLVLSTILPGSIETTSPVISDGFIDESDCAETIQTDPKITVKSTKKILLILILWII